MTSHKLKARRGTTLKLKQQPEDFQVEELTDVELSEIGTFALYRLEKTGWSTPDALAAISRRWKIDLHRVSYGGLKDRHAQTIQYFTILHGPRRNLQHAGVKVSYLGQTRAAYGPQDIRANAFRVTLRAMAPNQIPALSESVEEVRRDGAPNYFDDQRFGSVEQGGEFIGRLLVKGKFEEALQLALAGPYEYDRADQKKEKALLLAHWGNWARLMRELRHGHARILVNYLVSHPKDFRGAVARLRPELRGLYLSAYQSYLWNRMLAEALRTYCRPDQLVTVRLRLGDAPMHRGLDAGQRDKLTELQLPLPSARLKLAADSPALLYVKAVLQEEGLQLDELKVRGVRELFFSRGERAALCRPTRMTFDALPDDRHPGKQAARLAFELPRGSYATLIVKRVTAAH
ncbi:MAG: tRNA pseudouridine(13) synthase TruD [Gemmataceae bacterium]